jgi:uncharacterized BrkB/YihY/UPF0761 family membrane protein
VVLPWLYGSARIFLFGAEFASFWSRRALPPSP